MKRLEKKIFKGCFILFVLGLSSFCFAQSNHAVDEKLKEWNTHCDKLKGIPSGIENYPELIKAAKIGLRITPSTNYYYKSVFNFHLAGGYESTYKIDSAIHYYEVSKKYAEKANNNSRIVFALRRLAGLYDNKQMSAQGNEARNQLIEIAKIDRDEEIQVGVSIVLGEYYFNAGMWEKALQSYLVYIKYLKLDYAKTKNSASRSNIGVGYLAIGEIYQNLKRPAESLSYFKESTGYLDNYQEGLETAYKDLVTSYIALKKLDSGLYYYDKLNKSVYKSKDITILIDGQVELGRYYLAINKLKEAGEFLYEAERNVNVSQEKEDLYNVKMALGDLMLKQGKNGEAINNYKMALPLALYFKNKASIALLYYSLSKAERNLNLTNDAYNHVLEYAKYTDSIKTESISKNIIEMEARFQNGIKQQRISVLNNENEIKNIQLAQEKRTRWLLIGVSILSFFALGLIYLNVRNKQKANLLLNEKNSELDVINAKLNESNQTKTKLFSIISHDLRSPVSQLFTFLKLQEQNAALISEEEKNLHQQKLIHSSTNLLETMEDLLLWSKSQMENFALDIYDVEIAQLFEHASNLMSSQADVKQIKIKTGAMAFEYLESDENLLSIILRNLLQNAINHSHILSEVVLIAGLNDKNQKYISVINSGDEIPAIVIEDLINNVNVKSKSSGYGLLIVKELAQKLNANLQIVSNSEITTVSVLFS
ncbi:tetratricopeptide repeat-containing sensor histidine kinase [Pedobacter paludis]|uniref:histidine kinase n=1 Tax=Pedobacter paludis TaxID=2203212 RepID=A0A317EY55_9SPHI|nr:HAMP domain-containing sensor histidine kinase [Pedobacter paludis]PWS30727.1 hypothetical protein DF947_17535 [Pedobacter paludis]